MSRAEGRAFDERAPVPSWIVPALWPVSWVYGGAVAFRNLAYDRGWLASRRIEAPVVSVGNLALGGTGKTPTVIGIAKRLLARGIRPGIASRGYGRLSRGLRLVTDGTVPPLGPDEAGEEPVLMARQLPGVPIAVAERRIDAAREAVRLGAEIVLLDDGFQHRSLARDLDIVLVEGGTDTARERLFPAGRLREPVSALSRADVLMVRRKSADPEESARVRERFPRLVLSSAEFRPAHISGPAGEAFPLDALRGVRVVALSAIGNPSAFLATLGELGADVAAEIRHRDHHRYTARDFDDALRTREREKASFVVTTEKDAIRLGPLMDAKTPVRVVGISWFPGAGWEAVEERIVSLAGMGKARA
ncbi:MAG: tetraacyldisaccharide 4'-kinase [Nitrospirae bacterium]|nr:tetraacyldisaccharide 4'-kinase [Nitrospirota bacterium]